MYTALLVILILVVLIVTHELGHFIVAKIFGVRVDEFGVGYPPRAFTFGTWGGTEYTLNWIPFGGVVRLFGDEPDSTHGNGSFADASKWKQAIILLAGVAMNALMAWLLFAGALHAGVVRVDASPIPSPNSRLIVAQVIPGSPADVAGIAAWDRIISIIDERGVSPTALSPQAVISFIGVRGGKAINVVYVHAGATSTAIVRPVNAIIEDAANRPALGIALVSVSEQPLSWNDAFVESLGSTYHALLSVGNGLRILFVNAVRGSADLNDVVGPVGLVSSVNEAAHTGLGAFLWLAGFIAANLTVINLIPIPVLDGGRLVLVLFEAVTRRNAPRLLVQIMNTVGVALIIILMIVVTYHDIARLFA